MELAGHTYAFRTRPLEDALDALQQVGFELVEVWLGHAGASPGDVARTLDRRGLRAAAVSAGGIHSSDPSVASRAYALADALGTPVVVATVSADLLPTVARAVPEGITLCLENHWDQAFAQPREVARALAEVPGLMACLDTGHALLAGAPPERFAARLGRRLQHVHLKDARRPSPTERALGRRLRRRLLARPAAVFPGGGALRIDVLRRALELAEFEGVLSAEFEGDDAQAGSALAELRLRWLSATRPSPRTSAASP